MKNTAHAASLLGVDVVSGFTGSSIWDKVYFFPPTPAEMVEKGFADFAARWNPILDVFDEVGIRFAFEVHPSEIAYDIYTAERALAALDNRPSFGFNFDPSHLHWQFVDPVKFIDRFGDHRRGWDFRSVGRGEVDFQSIIRALNRIGYDGPLSIEWEDSGMDRIHGARESASYTRSVDFEPAGQAFDSAFEKE